LEVKAIANNIVLIKPNQPSTVQYILYFI
jgi:hypothetical protein